MTHGWLKFVRDAKSLVKKAEQLHLILCLCVLPQYWDIPT